MYRFVCAPFSSCMWLAGMYCNGFCQANCIIVTHLYTASFDKGTNKTACVQNILTYSFPSIDLQGQLQN